MLILVAVWGAALTLAMPQGAAAQGRAALAGQPQALLMQVHLDDVRAYAAPRTDAAVVAVYARNEQVMAVDKAGPYYKVVRPGGGSVGYVLGAGLVPLEGTGADVYPIGGPQPPARARFDLYGGVAVPRGAEAFADGYGPGLDVGARMSYGVTDALGLTARFSYSRFGQGERDLSADNVVRSLAEETSASLLSGALGLDVKLLGAGPVAFRLILDGGVYHAVVNEVVEDENIGYEETRTAERARGDAPAHDAPDVRATAFAEGTFTELGGSAAFRMSVRVGPAVHLFLEPSYELIRTNPEATHYAPLRLGFSLGQ